MGWRAAARTGDGVLKRAILKFIGLTLAFLTALAALPDGASAATVQASVLTNGSFESGVPGRQPGRVNRARFDSLNVSGPSWDVWNNIDDWRGVSGPGIEIQSDRTLPFIDAQDGDHYVQLDSTGNSSMSQRVRLGMTTYVLSFWYSPVNLNAATNTIAYNLGKVVSGQVTVGSNGATVGVWTEIRQTLIIPKGGTYDLVFAATGPSDGLGGLIDNVALTPIPLPAAGLLLLAGLAGLTGAARRRR